VKLGQGYAFGSECQPNVIKKTKILTKPTSLKYKAAQV
jgi:hypothetical protein